MYRASNYYNEEICGHLGESHVILAPRFFKMKFQNLVSKLLCNKTFNFHFSTISRSTEWRVDFAKSCNDRWPEYLACYFKKLSFKNGVHEKINFSVTEQRKRDTKSISFSNCEAVDFIDLEILKRFPNLNGLTFCLSNIPILKNIFTVELKMIQYLDLNVNKIKVLEAHVFDELVELKWIYLAYNEIEEILHPIFAKNMKLEFVNLSSNKIHTLHPNLFDGLPRLVEVRFSGNPTINKDFDQSDMKMLREELKSLFDNYWLKNENRIKELELVS
jgi:hypothetical protein